MDAISNLTTLKSQALIQFNVPLSDLDANTKLSITLGNDEHIFSIGNFAVMSLTIVKFQRY